MADRFVAAYAVFSVPAGNCDCVVVTVSGGAGFTRIPRLAVAFPLAASATCTVKPTDPAVLGVPEMVLPLNVRPAGNAPAEMVQLYGVMPPAAASVAE